MSVTEAAEMVHGIERTPGICGGYPVVVGTRTAVRHLIEHLRVNGGGVEELLRAFPHLSREQIEGALVYYAQCPALVDEDIERNRAAWEKLTGTTYDGRPVVP